MQNMLIAAIGVYNLCFAIASMHRFAFHILLGGKKTKNFKKKKCTQNKKGKNGRRRPK